MTRATRLLSLSFAALGVSCFAGTPVDRGASTRNAPLVSGLTARARAGGDDEGPLGFIAPVSRSMLAEELASQGIRPEVLGPMQTWVHRDRRTLMAVMNSFSRALGVRCGWCHVQGNFAAPTPRKAVAQYMWDRFVTQLSLRGGGALYCDSCHHGSTIFLDRAVPAKPDLLRYMNEEYAQQLRRRDGQSHGCATCHGEPFNPRFLPRESVPDTVHPPVAAPGPAQP